MLRKVVPMLAAGVVVGMIIASISLASTQTNGSETITVLAKTVKFKAVDLDTTGQSPGDLVVIKNALWDENQHRVGTNWINCTQSFGDVAVCTAAVQFGDRGQLTGTGKVPLNAQSFDFPITGGTGDFSNVTGWVHVTSQGQGKELEEYHLNNVA